MSAEPHGLHQLIDATGGGCCELRADGTIEAASAGFIALTAAPDQIAGLLPGAVIGELPAIDQLRAAVDPTSPVFRHVGADGLGRELAAAYVPNGAGASGGVLLLVDRSTEARLRRIHARLDRKIDDLEAKLAEREREPQRPRIRAMPELFRRLDEALTRARRYQHEVSVISIQIQTDTPPDERQDELQANEWVKTVGETLIGCVRGVDDLGRSGTCRWALILPHTPLAGAEIVATRVQIRLVSLNLGRIGVGVAQVGPDESGAVAVGRADQAGAQALESAGGVLLAVALV